MSRVAFVSGPVDALAVGGISIIHFFLVLWFAPAFLALASSLEGVTGLAVSGGAVAAYLTWVVNHPHFAATSARLYRSRQTIMQFPVTALVVPVVVLVLALLSLASPEGVAPWFIKMFLFWSSYHFSAQTLGVSLLYARRAGLVVEGITRRALSVFIFSTFLVPMLQGETFQTQNSYYSVTMSAFAVPPLLWILGKIIMAGVGVAAFLLLMRAAWQQEKRVPLLLLAPVAAQFVWFVPGSGVGGFAEFVPAYHSLQYLFIAWLMQLREKQVEGHLPPSRRYVGRESLRWMACNIAGGVFLFYLLPKGAQMLGLPATPMQTWGVVIAAVQVHHFFVDGVIWKLKNPAVGQPLQTSLAELTGRTS